MKPKKAIAPIITERDSSLNIPMKKVFQNPLLLPPAYKIEFIKLRRVGHTFTQLPHLNPNLPKRYIVQDFILDQTGTSGGLCKMVDLISLNFNDYNGYRFSIIPKGYNGIKVAPPLNTTAYFGVGLGREQVDFNVSDFYDAIPTSVSFSMLNGAAPILNYNEGSITHATNSSLKFDIEGAFTNTFTFYQLDIKAFYGTRNLLPGTAQYKPHFPAIPFGLHGPRPISYVLFSYTTYDPIDPGPFVSLF